MVVPVDLDVVAVAAHGALVFLALGAIGKLRSPLPAAHGLIAAGATPRRWLVGSVRVVAGVELAAAFAGSGLVVQGWPAQAGAATAAVLFALFALVVLSAMRRGVTDCGCVGAAPSPPDRVHVALNLVAAACCAALAFRAAPVGPAMGSAATVAYLSLVGCAGWLLVAVVAHRSVLAALVTGSKSARTT